MKIDDEIVELEDGRGARPAAYVARLTRPGQKASSILVIGAPNLGEDPREDVDGRRDWWADM